MEAIRLLGQLTRGRFDIWMLAGRHNAATRAKLMAVLLGVPKVPQAQAGVYAMREEFYRQLFITEGCLAEREDKFVEYCKALVSEQAAPAVLLGPGGDFTSAWPQ